MRLADALGKMQYVMSVNLTQLIDSELGIISQMNWLNYDQSTDILRKYSYANMCMVSVPMPHLFLDSMSHSETRSDDQTSPRHFEFYNFSAFPLRAFLF